ncbi:hypothetical protein C2E23DRAFT_242903 [Lenzites betulinus]|nr:hypothetical protein C2E23DRAFT_242903 [Lenzites betulinus]
MRVGSAFLVGASALKTFPRLVVSCQCRSACGGLPRQEISYTTNSSYHQDSRPLHSQVSRALENFPLWVRLSRHRDTPSPVGATASLRVGRLDLVTR